MGHHRLSSVVLLLVCLNTFGASYFVSKSGNDANSGLSGSPWLTISKATSVAAAGDSVTVSNGVYNEFVALASSGTPGNQITFTAVSTNAIIDPSTDISGSWVAAPEVGTGVYKRTGLPLTVRYLSINNSNVASVYTNQDITAQIGNVFAGSGLTLGTQCLAVASAQTFLRDGVQCSFWDPLGALYCVDGTTCYLRLRDGSSPNSLTIRGAPRNDNHTTFQPSFATSAVAMSGRSNIVFQGFQVRNAFAAFYLLNSSSVTIQSNLIVGTFYRQYMEGSGSSNNVFTGNLCIGNFYGNLGGNWEGSTSAVAENKHGTYVWGKYMMGESSTFDNPLKFSTCGSSNVVSYNVIYSGLGANGISLAGDIANPMYGTLVYGNTISYQSSVGYLDSFGNTYSQIFSNAFVDCDVSYRPHELNTTGETTRTNFFYRNTSFLSGGLGNHVFCFAESSGGTYKPSLNIYFNSFSGGNFAVQFNANTETSGACGHMLFFNNILSGATAYFDGPPGFSMDANAVGGFDYNLITPSSAGSTAWFGAHNIKTNNVWSTSPGTSFALPLGSPAINSALDVSGTFTLASHTYSGFPDGATKIWAWDMGALEAGGLTNNAASCSQGDIQAAIAVTIPGGVVIVPAGTCAPTISILLTNQITLFAQGTILQDSIINTSDGTNSCIINVSVGPSPTNMTRVSGFTFQTGSRATRLSDSGNIHLSGGANNVRIDHNSFLAANNIGIGGGDVFGVIDHNVFSPSGAPVNPIKLTHQSYGGPANGYGAWALPSWTNSYQEDGSAIYIENNNFTNSSGVPGKGIDGFGGARWVSRYNVFDRMIDGGQGTDTNGQFAGCRLKDSYNNLFIEHGDPECGHYSSGSGVWVSNVIVASATGFTCRNNRMAYGGFFRYANATNAWDLNDAAIYSAGTATAGGALSMTDSTKAWTPNQWIGFSIRNVPSGRCSVVTGNSATTVNYIASIDSPASDTVFSPGQAYQFRKVTTVLDEVGRGQGALRNAAVPSWPNQVVDPVWQWANTIQ